MSKSPARSAAEIEQRRTEIETQLGEPITLDLLTESWVMYQRKRGHRHSTDDLLTAWYAIQHGFPNCMPEACPRGVGTSKKPCFLGRGGASLPVMVSQESVETLFSTDSERLLDLGTGIGTVGLLVLSQAPNAHLTAVEAQEISFGLFQDNLWANGQAGLVKAIHADLRHAKFDDASFDLISGSPPYFDVSAGIVPNDSQKAHARFELRGTVFDYCRVAARALAPNGAFVFCFPFAQKARAERACAESGLEVVRARDVVPREQLPPLFSLFLCRHPGSGRRVDEPPFVVRDASGRHTAEMTQVRQLFGMKPQ